MAEFVKISKTKDVPLGENCVVDAQGKQLALFNIQGVFCAIDNLCIHRGGPLGEDVLEGTTVTCSWHAWTYNVNLLSGNVRSILKLG